MVQDGMITLTEDEDWYYQQKAAQDAVRDLTGVVGVKNSMTIKPAVPTVKALWVHDLGPRPHRSIHPRRMIFPRIQGGEYPPVKALDLRFAGGTCHYSQAVRLHRQCHGTIA
jgi:hypothetical protein